MHSMTVVVLACLVAVAFAHVQYEQLPAEELSIPSDVHSNTEQIRSKRSILLLKKKLLLGALGIKAAKVGAVGAGVAGALALKKVKSVPHHHTHHQHHVVVPHGLGWSG